MVGASSRPGRHDGSLLGFHSHLRPGAQVTRPRSLLPAGGVLRTGLVLVLTLPTACRDAPDLLEPAPLPPFGPPP